MLPKRSWVTQLRLIPDSYFYSEANYVLKKNNHIIRACRNQNFSPLDGSLDIPTPYLEKKAFMWKTNLSGSLSHQKKMAKVGQMLVTCQGK